MIINRNLGSLQHKIKPGIEIIQQTQEIPLAVWSTHKSLTFSSALKKREHLRELLYMHFKLIYFSYLKSWSVIAKESRQLDSEESTWDTSEDQLPSDCTGDIHL